MNAKYLTVFLLVAATTATIWMILGSFVSYMPMSATDMQNIYISRAMKYGGCIIALQIAALVVLLVGQRHRTESSAAPDRGGRVV